MLLAKACLTAQGTAVNVPLREMLQMTRCAWTSANVKTGSVFPSVRGSSSWSPVRVMVSISPCPDLAAGQRMACLPGPVPLCRTPAGAALTAGRGSSENPAGARQSATWRQNPLGSDPGPSTLSVKTVLWPSIFRPCGRLGGGVGTRGSFVVVE